MAGRAAAWLVAYVLVLQSVLAGLALGAMPSGPDAQLCLSSASASSTDKDAGHEGGAPDFHHCQACLARADVPALPPPPPVPGAAPLAGAFRLDFGASETAPRLHVLSAFQARAPPVLA